MLQIILFILKLIGWILLAVLGLLVLVTAALLFTPLHYRVETSCKGTLSTLEAALDFRILFRLVSGKIRYRDEKLLWNIRAAWIRLGNQAEAEEVEESVEESLEEAEKNIREKGEEVLENIPVQAAEAEKSEEHREKPEEHKEKPEEYREKPEEHREKLESAEEKKEKPAKEPKDLKKEESAETEKAENPAAFKKINNKMAAVFKKIKDTFDRICDKIRILLEKAEIVKAFLTDEVHQSAFLKCLAELKKMVIRLRPKRIKGEIRFGFEDPSLTGKVLAGASILYPYWGEHICCCPDFENKVLEGEVSVEGLLRLLPAAVLGWNLLWNKNVRRTAMDVKRFFFK